MEWREVRRRDKDVAGREMKIRDLGHGGQLEEEK